jgi:hypothetical protein
MEINRSTEQPENAWFSIRDNLEFDSNVTVESLKQPLKQLAQRTSTEEGMTIDEIDEQPQNAEASMVWSF